MNMSATCDQCGAELLIQPGARLLGCRRCFERFKDSEDYCIRCVHEHDKHVEKRTRKAGAMADVVHMQDIDYRRRGHLAGMGPLCGAAEADGTDVLPDAGRVTCPGCLRIMDMAAGRIPSTSDATKGRILGMLAKPKGADVIAADAGVAWSGGAGTAGGKPVEPPAGGGGYPVQLGEYKSFSWDRSAPFGSAGGVAPKHGLHISEGLADPRPVANEIADRIGIPGPRDDESPGEFLARLRAVKPVTDLDAFRGMLERAGIEFEMVTAAYDDRGIGPPVESRLKIQNTEYHFDKDGRLLALDHFWEL